MFTYVDGNNNTYRLDRDGILTYHPISKQQSSSGFYSGGDPKAVDLAADDFALVVDAFEYLFTDNVERADERRLGTAMVIRSEPRERIYIGRRSPATVEFETTLSELLGK